jgi:hypothetical protein
VALRTGFNKEVLTGSKRIKLDVFFKTAQAFGTGSGLEIARLNRFKADHYLWKQRQGDFVCENGV